MILPPLAIAAAAAAFLPLVLLKRPLALAAFCGLIVLYPARFILPLPGMAIPSTLVEVLFWMLFIAWLADTGLRAESWSALRRWAVPLTLFMTGAVIGVLVAPDLRAALGLWRAYFLEPILFFPMFVDTVTRHKSGRHVLAALAATSAFIGVTAVYQKITGYGIPNPFWQAAATRRVTSIFGFPNGIGLFLAPVTVLLTGWAFSLPWALSALVTVAITLALLAIVFAVSEGAAIGVAAGLTVFFLAQKRTRPFILGAMLMGLLAALTVPALNTYAIDLIGLTDDSGSVRRIVWDASVRMLADNPVFGAGLSGYAARLVPYHHAPGIEIFMYPHNVVLNFWSEIGLIGLIGFAWIVARFFRNALTMFQKKKGGWLPLSAACAMLALLVHGLVDVPYFKNDLAFLFWIIVGLVEANAIVTIDKPPAPPKKDPRDPELPVIRGHGFS